MSQAEQAASGDEPTAARRSDHRCPGAAIACPLAAHLLEPLSGTPEAVTAASLVDRLRPCTACRYDTAAIRERFKGVRLGRRERAVLVRLGHGGASLFPAQGTSHSQYTSERRALLTLAKAGLVAHDEAAPATSPTVSLTALGTYVIKAYGRYIATGKAIRWDRPAPGIAVGGSSPESLVGETLARVRGELRATIGDIGKVLRRSLAGPLTDPDQLAGVTSHLETKARALMAILTHAEPPVAEGIEEPSADATVEPSTSATPEPADGDAAPDHAAPILNDRDAHPTAA